MPKIPTKPQPQPTGSRTSLQRLEELLKALTPIPDDWYDDTPAMNDEDTGLECLECTSWLQLRAAWEEAMEWTEGLEHALVSMLAVITSTMSVGDQLWIKVIGPPSCGKSTLCEAISVSKTYVMAKSTIRGFHSGYSSKNKDEDNSLISKLYGMTLATKDGDTLLSAPNMPQILAEGRDIYDGTSRTEYRNEKSTDYEGLRMTWILCGTESLRTIDSSELGERFLDCVLMRSIDDDIEDLIGVSVARKAAQNATIEAGEVAEKQYEPKQGKKF